jgi:hypothetical protein
MDAHTRTAPHHNAARESARTAGIEHNARMAAEAGYLAYRLAGGKMGSIQYKGLLRLTRSMVRGN